ncbi:MAG: hypothetical protein JWP75_3320 [Frondihabitans sp.]|nr:hypothetical protein [Frondihabitans sp.]
MIFTHRDGFLDRLELRTEDDRAHAWAQLVDTRPVPSAQSDDDVESVESEFSGSLDASSWVPSQWNDDDVVNLRQDMEFYLRTLVQVMASASPHLERAWRATGDQWTDQQGVEFGSGSALDLPAAEECGDLIPIGVTLEAETVDELRAAFVPAAFEAISPWARE